MSGDSRGGRLSLRPPEIRRISVIVCAYSLQRLEDTLKAIESVHAQSRLPDEIVMAVDNNKDLYERLLKCLPANVSLYLNDQIRGLSETRNVAVNASTGQIVAFLDDDAIAAPDWLERLIEPFDDAQVMAVGGRSAPAWPGGKRPSWFPDEFDFIIGCTGHKSLMLGADNEIRNVTGSNMAFRREVFDQLGGWKVDLGRGQTKTGGEEAEICLRIKARLPGSRIVYQPSSVVHHKVTEDRATLRYVLSYAYNEGPVRAMLRRCTLQYSSGSLAAEGTFLRRLFLVAVPAKLKTFYKAGSLAQVGIIFANTMLMGFGYLHARLRYG